MDDTFTISIFRNGVESSYDGRLVTIGYTHKFCVVINGLTVAYEPDEERTYRAIVSIENSRKISEEERLIIQAIKDRLDSINS